MRQHVLCVWPKHANATTNVFNPFRRYVFSSFPHNYSQATIVYAPVSVTLTVVR